MFLTIEITITIAGVLALIYLIVDRTFSAPRYHGPITNHFNGRNFRNLEPPERRGLIDFLRWQLTSQRGHWNKWTDSKPGSAPPTRLNGKDLRVTFVNHATVLIQTEGLNIVTDPIWSERASPVSWAGPKRHRSPGLRFQDLPPIDIVLISHNHYDHLDIKTLVRLHAEHRPRFVTGVGNRAFLEAHEITDVTELDWWEAANFSGDTGMGSHFVEIKNRFAPFRLALLSIGAYLPIWFMHPVHISPSEAIEVHHLLEPRVSMAIHFGTFALGDDGEFEPVANLREALSYKDKSDSHFWILDHGEGRDVL